MNPLALSKKNITSQWGEDGIIEEIFKRIGESTKTCVEFGAWDGKHMSNTWQLWRNKGWSAVLIEGDARRFVDLKTAVGAYPKVTPYQAFVEKSGSHSLDHILGKINVKKIDLLSIDIDGDDYYIFESLTVKPRVIVIEYNPTIPPSLSLVNNEGNYFGSSAKALVELGKKKSYTLSAITETNCIFVEDGEFSKLGIEPVSLEEDFPSKHITYIISAYDGTAFASQTPPYSKMKRLHRKKPVTFMGKTSLVPITLKVRTSRKKWLKHTFGKIPGLKSFYKKVLDIKAVSDWKRNGRPMPAPHRIKEEIVMDYTRKFGAKTFIETGTYMGEMITAVRKQFENIISIELDTTLAREAQNKFSQTKNIRILQGDSSVLLPGIIKNLSGKVLFWLDAHYSGGITAKGSAYTPILSEVETISHYPHEHIVLLVDDARLFTGRDEYPKLSDFKEFILKKFPHHSFEVKDDVIRIIPL